MLLCNPLIKQGIAKIVNDPDDTIAGLKMGLLLAGCAICLLLLFIGVYSDYQISNSVREFKQGFKF